MTPSIVAIAKYQPGAASTSFTLATPAGILAGDAIVVFVPQPGSVGSLTVTGLTLAQDYLNEFTGQAGYVFSKMNCAPADSGVTLTFTFGQSIRVPAMILVIRGAATAGGLWGGEATTNLVFGSAGVTSPVVSPSVTGGLELAVVMGDTTTPPVTAWATPAGITLVDSIYDVGPISGQAMASIVVGSAAGATTSGTNIGGDLWTSGGVSTVASAWAMVIAPLVAANSVRPNVVVSNPGGWSNVGGSPSLQASAADELDSTYAETPASPSPAAITYAHPALNAGLVTILTRDSCSAASPPMTRTVTLMEGATARASFNFVLSTTITAHTYTTTSGESAAITNRSALRVLISDTV